MNYEQQKAFPVQSGDHDSCQEGMSLLDYFAGQAIIGTLPNASDPDAAAIYAYKVAALMMHEREKHT